ncbi:MAG: Trk system potassium transporter TrkA [Firmicutes bacterium]|nr:Trk system potassium transporter TrkA [Bacillota bacterium]
MKILIAGCGKIGSEILVSLVSEGHDVTILDTDSSVITELTNIYDVIGVCGNCTDCETLSEAGVEDTDMYIAVAGSDELNMLSCFIAKRMGAKHTIARIRNPEYNDSSLDFMRQQLDLSMSINPEMLAAEALNNILKLPSALKIETFSRRNFEMIELHLKENSLLNGLKLSELRDKYKAKVLVGVVQRGDEVHIPDGSFILKSGDRIGITATASEIQKFLRSIGVLQKQARSVMILGGSKTAYYLAKKLETAGTSVRIIEKDPKLCAELCDALPKAFILNGDGAKQELLTEEGIASQDAFVSLTGIDEENILISYFAMSQNVPKVITKVNRDELMPLAEKLGLDCIISPKKIIVDVIVKYARALRSSLGSNVETLYKLMDGKAEALEFKVSSDWPMLRKPLRELSFKRNILITGIIRDRKTIIPAGDDVILPGDHVIVLAADQILSDMSDILV